VVEALAVDSDGDEAALVYFGSRHPQLRSDSAWIYGERLESNTGKGVEDTNG
jgi:hypothetical protein